MSWLDATQGIQLGAGTWALPAGTDQLLLAAGSPVIHRGSGKLYVHADSSDSLALTWAGPEWGMINGVRTAMFAPPLTVANGEYVVEIKCPTANPPGRAPLNTFVPLAPGLFVETISRDRDGTAICNYPNNVRLRAMTDGRSRAVWSSTQNYEDGSTGTLSVIYERSWVPREWVNFNDMQFQVDDGQMTFAVESNKLLNGGSVLDTLIEIDGGTGFHTDRGSLVRYDENRTGYYFWLNEPGLVPRMLTAQKLAVSFWPEVMGGAGIGFQFDIERVRHILQDLTLGKWRCP